MSKDNNTSVIVTGEERPHPAIRMLAKACLELARVRLLQRRTTGEVTVPKDGAGDE